MEPYKLKHLPSGYYFQPLKYRGSHFSKKGKIYQTKTNILHIGYYSDGSYREELRIEAHPSTIVYKETKDLLNWQEGNKFNPNMYLITKSEEWEIEYI